MNVEKLKNNTKTDDFQTRSCPPVINSNKNSGDGPDIKYFDLDGDTLHNLNNTCKAVIDNFDITNDGQTNTVSKPASIKNVIQDETLETHLLNPALSNNTFSINITNKDQITNIFEGVKEILNKLNITNNSTKYQLSNELEKLGIFMIARDLIKTHSTNDINYKSKKYIALIQKLQMYLLYLIEHLSKTENIYVNIQNQIEKIQIIHKKGNINYTEDNTLSVNEKRDKKIEPKCIKNIEEDILSVEELSWDDHHLILDKLERNNLENNSSLINFNKKYFNTTNNEAKSGENGSNYDSINTQNSTSFTLPSYNKLDCSSGEHSTFLEIKNKFERSDFLNEFKPTNRSTVSSWKSSNKPKSSQSKTNNKSNVAIALPYISPKDPIVSENTTNNLSICEDQIDNSAFLVSSIDSFSESHKSIDKPKTNRKSNNNAHLEPDLIQPVGEIQTSFIVEECCHLSLPDPPLPQPPLIHPPFKLINRTFTNSHNSTSLVAFDTIDLPEHSTNAPEKELKYFNQVRICSNFSKQMQQNHHRNHHTQNNCHHSIEDKSLDQFIEIANDDLANNGNSKKLESPYIIPKDINDSKIQISEEIIVESRHPKKNSTRSKICRKSNLSEKFYSNPNYYHMKELIDTERVYVKQLYILSQVLHHRIKSANIISLRNFNYIFPPSVHSIYKFHLKFSNELESIFQNNLNLEIFKALVKSNQNLQIPLKQNTCTVKLGQKFLEYLEQNNWQFFSCYKDYFSKVNYSIHIYQQLKKNSPKFERFIKSLCHIESCNGQELGYFLILPLQKISKYLTGLRKILSNVDIKSEERVSILAVEHLFQAFLNENYRSSEFQNALSMYSKTVKTLESVSSPSTTLKSELVQSQNSEISSSNHPPINVSNNCNNYRPIVNEKLSFFNKLQNCNTLKKFASYSRLDNVDNLKQGSKDFQCSANNLVLSTYKDNENTSDSIPPIESGSIFQVSDNINLTNDKFLELPILENKAFVTNYDLIANNGTDSVNLDDYNLKPFNKKVTKFNQTKANEECSVCLNSQEEFEIDTSVDFDELDGNDEGDDEKTCIQEDPSVPTIKEIRPNNTLTKNQSNQSTEIKENDGLLEFCANSRSKSITSTYESSFTSLRSTLHNPMSFVLFGDLLPNFADNIISKKVYNLITLYSNVILETMKFSSLQNISKEENLKRSPKKSTPNIIEKISLSLDEKQFNESQDFVNYDEKSVNKKFSFRQLFSLKRRTKHEPVISQHNSLNESRYTIRTVAHSRSFKKSD